MSGWIGKFPPAAVDEHAEEDPLGAAEVGELVEGGADGPAGVEDVVHDDDGAAVERAGQVRLPDHGADADGLEVVAIEGDVELAARHLHAFGRLDQASEPLGELDAPALDADKQEALRSLASLDDFNGHARQGARDGSFVEQRGT